MAPIDTPLVHQYLWRDYSLPRYQNVVMTVNTFEGIVCFSFFAALVTLAQTRSWICTRSIIFRISRPIQLTLEPNHPDSKQRLTQAKAIRALVRRLNPQDNLSMLSVPKNFGIAAVINIIVFFLLGIFVPLLLTGFLSTAVVQSKSTNTCAGYELDNTRKQYAVHLAGSYYKRCLVVSGSAPPSCSQESGILGSMPVLWENTGLPCPFSDDLCQADAIKFEHKKLRPQNYGVNLDIRILVDHRVTCAPIKTERFMYIPQDRNGRFVKPSIIWFGRSLLDGPVKQPSAVYGVQLETVNGPNQFSSNFSGNEIMQWLPKANSGNGLTVFPWSEGGDLSNDEGFHPSLNRTDGDVFIVMLKAGITWYRSDAPIDDPFYSAHNKGPDNMNFTYIPDHEATALGCLEQFRLCLAGDDGICTEWGPSLGVVMALRWKADLIKEERENLYFIYSYLTNSASIKHMFYLRTSPDMLVTSLSRQGDLVNWVPENEGWIGEVKSWFQMAFITTKYQVMQIITRDSTKRAKDAPASIFKICGVVIFQTNEYTNINFIGLLVTICSFLLICAASFWSKISKPLREIMDLLRTGWKFVLWICVLIVEPHWSRFKIACEGFSWREFLQDVCEWRPKLPRLFQRAFWRAFWEERRSFRGIQSGTDWINLTPRTAL